jgi:hypothetical protein
MKSNRLTASPRTAKFKSQVWWHEKEQNKSCYRKHHYAGGHAPEETRNHDRGHQRPRAKELAVPINIETDRDANAQGNGTDDPAEISVSAHLTDCGNDPHAFTPKNIVISCLAITQKMGCNKGQEKQIS